MCRRLRRRVTFYSAGVAFFAIVLILAISVLAPYAPRTTAMYCLVAAAMSLYPMIACAHRDGRRRQSLGERAPTDRCGHGYVFDASPGDDYDWKRLIDVCLLATREHIHRDIQNYYCELLGRLEARFELRVVPPSEAAEELGTRYAFVMLMRSAIRSYHESTTPTSSMLEGGLLYQKLDDAGEDGRRVLALLERIGQGHSDMRRAHVDLIRILFTMIHGTPTTVVTSGELRVNGFDDSNPPKVSDYWEHA
ncbi:MAG TPA: hypothetical protein P5081_19430 [Phycisphaerae bacterium]|nr:hypothetical protein [Phycisphaerae bacterium]HRW55048.1 hypothetical protein [Phycisphaerae bacterium]